MTPAIRIASSAPHHPADAEPSSLPFKQPADAAAAALPTAAMPTPSPLQSAWAASLSGAELLAPVPRRPLPMHFQASWLQPTEYGVVAADLKAAPPAWGVPQAPLYAAAGASAPGALMPENHVALADGAWMLADVPPHSDQQQACNAAQTALPSASVQAAWPLNMPQVAHHLFALQQMGWDGAAVSKLAMTQHGAQSLAELAHFAPNLLRRGYLHSILASCATTPGALAVLAAMRPPQNQAQPIVGIAAQDLSAVAHGGSATHPAASARPLRPLVFSTAELNRIRRLPEGAERVAALMPLSYRLDSTRLSKRDALTVACGPDGVFQLQLAHAMAPSMHTLGMGLEDIFLVLSHRGGSDTLKTLYRLSHALSQLHFSVAVQVKMAAKASGDRWLNALVHYTRAAYHLGWTQQDLERLALSYDAAETLTEVIRLGPWLQAMGLSPHEQIAFIKIACTPAQRAHMQDLFLWGLFLGCSRQQLLTLARDQQGTNNLAAVVACAPMLFHFGFTVEQVCNIGSLPLGDQALQTLASVAGALMVYGFGPGLLTLMAEAWEGGRVYSSLLNCLNKHHDRGLTAELLQRAALLNDGASYLVCIEAHWPALLATGPNAQKALHRALLSHTSAESFEHWMAAAIAPCPSNASAEVAQTR